MAGLCGLDLITFLSCMVEDFTCLLVTFYRLLKLNDISLSDTEAPTCGFCPPDIVKDDRENAVERVNWDRAECTDNSGDPPSLVSSRPNGDLFAVPGNYDIVYTATDEAGNENKNCSFRISLSSEYSQSSVCSS